MERNKLIAYSLMYQGEYSSILKAINENVEIPSDIMNKASNVTNAITLFDNEYPKAFLDLKYPPFVIWTEGNADLLKESCIGVVGSRMPHSYSVDATRSLVISNKDKVIVSGLAKGIDTIAHQEAKKTIAVLGCGIDYIYPQANKQLYKQILDNNGLLISEYPEITKPLSFHFPFRNRLIAALSNTLYVMECKRNSGTTTAINDALELGRNVKVLPQSIYVDCECYNNTLINEGAGIILSGVDVFVDDKEAITNAQNAK